MAYGHVLYAEVDTFINEVCFPVMVPLLYIQQKRDQNLEPFFVPDQNESVRSALPIADLIDLADKNLMFSVVIEKDILYIYECVSIYSKELAKYPNHPEASKYFLKCKNFLKLLERSITILSKKFPEEVAAVKRMNVLDIVNLYSE